VGEAVEAMRREPSLARAQLTKTGDTAIHIGAWQGHGAVVDAALSHGVEVDARGDLGRTALHYACLEGRLALVSSLLAAGADPAVVDELGRDAVTFALSAAAFDIVAVLRAAGVELTIQQAASAGDWEEVERRVAQDPEALRALPDSWQVLADAVFQLGMAEFDAMDDPAELERITKAGLVRVTWLIDHGARVDGERPGHGPLFQAVQLLTPAVARLLVERGAKADERTLVAARDRPEMLAVVAQAT
jgi:hypothetical protein